MDDPVQDVPDVVRKLTSGSPQVQEETINNYFTPDASFTHPFCRTGSFPGSRLLVHAIFRWYKIMSPGSVHPEIKSVAYDAANLTLYVTISQIFAIWFIPFHRAPVTLTTVLRLTQHPDSSKYYITSQNDLYQVDQFVRFFAPWGIGTTAVLLWHVVATFFCVVLACVGAPVTWAERAYYAYHQDGGKGSPHGVNGINGGARSDDGQVKKLMGFGNEDGASAKGDATTATTITGRGSSGT